MVRLRFAEVFAFKFPAGRHFFIAMFAGRLWRQRVVDFQHGVANCEQGRIEY